MWGVLPLYWKLLGDVSAPEILCHRILWSLFFLIILLRATGLWPLLFSVFRSRALLARCLCTGSIITVNWCLYIWAVHSGYTVEASLGYFICPLVSVALGQIFYGEVLSVRQRIAFLLALGGVVFLGISLGTVPWISLTLAISFAAYGALKKRTEVDALVSLTVETVLLALPTLAVLVWITDGTGGAIFHGSFLVKALLVLSGIVTAAPLALYGIAARRIPLSLLGFCQYVGPTIQLSIGVFLFGEPFTDVHLFSFGLIWTGILLFLSEGIRFGDSEGVVSCQ